jgi:hypothetical protein
VAGAGTWAKGRLGDEGADSASADSASPSDDDPTSYSSASSDSYEDDKFHLPGDHRPFVLLPGWDKPPAPPPVPDVGIGSESGSDSGGGSESGSESGGGDGASPGSPEQPPAPPPREPGFSCQDCAYFKALGNGTFGCENGNYRRWAGTDRLVETKSGRPVVNPERACSDWFEPATGVGAKRVPTRHNAGA